jgi:hypothetical protein
MEEVLYLVGVKIDFFKRFDRGNCNCYGLIIPKSG